MDLSKLSMFQVDDKKCQCDKIGEFKQLQKELFMKSDLGSKLNELFRKKSRKSTRKDIKYTVDVNKERLPTKGTISKYSSDSYEDTGSTIFEDEQSGYLSRLSELRRLGLISNSLYQLLKKQDVDLETLLAQGLITKSQYDLLKKEQNKFKDGTLSKLSQMRLQGLITNSQYQLLKKQEGDLESRLKCLQGKDLLTDMSKLSMMRMQGLLTQSQYEMLKKGYTLEEMLAQGLLTKSQYEMLKKGLIGDKDKFLKDADYEGISRLSMMRMQGLITQSQYELLKKGYTLEEMLEKGLITKSQYDMLKKAFLEDEKKLFKDKYEGMSKLSMMLMQGLITQSQYDMLKKGFTLEDMLAQGLISKSKYDMLKRALVEKVSRLGLATDSEDSMDKNDPNYKKLKDMQKYIILQQLHKKLKAKHAQEESAEPTTIKKPKHSNLTVMKNKGLLSDKQYSEFKRQNFLTKLDALKKQGMVSRKQYETLKKQEGDLAQKAKALRKQKMLSKLPTEILAAQDAEYVPKLDELYKEKLITENQYEALKKQENFLKNLNKMQATGVLTKAEHDKIKKCKKHLDEDLTKVSTEMNHQEQVYVEQVGKVIDYFKEKPTKDAKLIKARAKNLKRQHRKESIIEAQRILAERNKLYTIKEEEEGEVEHEEKIYKEFKLRLTMSDEKFYCDMLYRMLNEQGDEDSLSSSDLSSLSYGESEESEIFESDESDVFQPYTDIYSSSERRAITYLQKHKILEFFHFLGSHLVSASPEDPLDFLIGLLNRCLEYRRRGIYATAPLLFCRRHVESLYFSMDPMKTGFIDVSQYITGMETLRIMNIDNEKLLKCLTIDKDTFINDACDLLLRQFMELIQVDESQLAQLAIKDTIFSFESLSCNESFSKFNITSIE